MPKWFKVLIYFQERAKMYWKGLSKITTCELGSLFGRVEMAIACPYDISYPRTTARSNGTRRPWWSCSWCMCIFCVRDMIVWNGVLERSFPVVCLRTQVSSKSWNLLSPFLLDSMMFSLCILWSDTCSPLPPRFRFLILGNLPRGYVVGKPSWGLYIMLGIYSKYNGYLSVWLNVVYDCHKSYHE